MMRCLALGFLVLLIAHVSACQTPSPPPPVLDACVETRAALDVGSGSTKLKVAKVDVCQLRLGEVLLEAQEKVSYQDDLQSSADGTLSPGVLAQGLTAIKTLKAKAVAFHPKGVVAIATSAFRKAKNGAEAAASLGRDSGLTIRVISQEEEGHVGFLGAAHSARRPLDRVAVWDVGGGSQQITTRDVQGRFRVFESALASVSFKNHLVKNVQHKKEGASPNPISKADMAAGLRHVRDRLRSVPDDLKAFLASNETEILGIGGVHFHSVRAQVGADSYDRKALDATLAKRLGLHDREIGGDFFATDVSNLILIRGVMEALGIKNVATVNVNLTDGAMLHARLWSE